MITIEEVSKSIAELEEENKMLRREHKEVNIASFIIGGITSALAMLFVEWAFGYI